MFPNSEFAHPAPSFTVPMTPPGVDPRDAPQTTVTINCAWLKYIRGALTQLLLQSSWDVAGDDLGVVQSQVWRLISLFGEVDCNVCDCITLVGGKLAKFVPDGHGGGSMEVLDARTEGTPVPPWPSPPEGQTGNCLTAANIAAYFSSMMGHTANILGTEAEIGALIVSFVDWLELELGPAGIVLDYAINFAEGALAAGATVFASAFDSTTQTAAFDGIRCLFECHANSDGSLTSVEIEAIKEEFFTKIDGWVVDTAENALWRLFFPDFLDSQGPNGLNGLGKVLGILAYDCSGCGCGWCYNYDFKSSLYDWTTFDRTDEDSVTEWQSGVGVVGHLTTTIDLTVCDVIFKTGTITSHVQELRIKYKFVDAPSGSVGHVFFNWNDAAGTNGNVENDSLTVDGEEHEVLLVVDADVVSWHVQLSLAGSVTKDPSALAVITNLRIFGSGDAPFGSSSC